MASALFRVRNAMSDEIKNKKLSRRQFIGTAAAGAAVISAGTLVAPRLTGGQVTGAPVARSPLPRVSGSPTLRNAAQPAQVPTNWAQTADVVVVGIGLAGLAAAVAANDAGAMVTILEKMPQTLEGEAARCLEASSMCRAIRAR